MIARGLAAKTPAEQHFAHHQFLKVFGDFRGRPKAEREQVCDILSKLDARTMIMMERSILDHENTYLESCREQLHKAMEDVYEKDREELRQKHGVIHHPDASQKKSNDRSAASSVEDDRCVGKVGNYPPIEIETVGGPSFGPYATIHTNPHTSRPPGLGPKEIILTLDDGPVPGRTEKALLAFEEHCVHATLFLVGQSVATEGGQILLKRELDMGHNVGNHTYTHPDNLNSPKLTTQERLEEVTRDGALLDRSMVKFKAMTPANAEKYVKTPFFRFPGGNQAQDVLDFLHASNMPNFTWHAGANDWLPHMTAELELQEALKELRETSGGILIVHDTHQATVDMIPYLLEELEKEGFKIRHMIPKRHLLNEAGIVSPTPNDGSLTPAEPEATPMPPPPPLATPTTPAAPASAVTPLPAQTVVTAFAKLNVSVRDSSLANATEVNDSTLLRVAGGTVLKTSELKSVTVLGDVIKVGEFTFFHVHIDKAQAGFESFEGQSVYIWSAAFNPAGPAG